MKYSFETLEFNRVIDIMESYLHTYSGKCLLESIRPMTDHTEIVYRLNLAKEALELTKFDTKLTFDEVSDISQCIEATGKEGFFLSAEEMLQIKRTLLLLSENLSAMNQYLEKYPLLSSMLMTAPEIPKSFLRQLDQTMDDEGNILDNATPELKRIRKKKYSLKQDIQNMLLKMMDSEEYKEGVQEKLITVRDGRFVIPVRNAFKNRIRCIVHSFSKSGETVFVEPESAVMMNNEMVGIDEEEMAEIRRILRELTAEVHTHAEDILQLAELLGELEILNAKARFAREYRCEFVKIVKESRIDLQNAYHPLLDRNKDIIPINIEVGGEFQGLVISGPNAGGKTVALKMTGLLTLMAMSGLPVTAGKDSTIGIFGSVLAEIGDEQSITNNLSTFSGHIVSLAGILEACDRQSLVLIDEIAAATEPKEGEALGREIIRSIIEKGARFITTTHYQGIKSIAYTDERVRNAFVEFDEKRLIPMYQMHLGGTGSSYALKIARRYGIDEAVIQRAEHYLEENSGDAEKIIKSVERERNLLLKHKETMYKRLSDVRKMKENYQRLMRDVENEKKLIETKGIGALKKDLDEALRQISALKADIKAKKNIDLKEALETARNAENVLKQSMTEQMERERKRPDEIKIGQDVFVPSLNKQGVVAEISDDKLKIRIGIIHTYVSRDEVFCADAAKQSSGVRAYSYVDAVHPIDYLLDFRGMRAEEALRTLEKYIDNAVVSGISEFMIIHGKGEGILRKMIWDYLATMKTIKSYRYAKPEEGGQGKTIVELR